MNTNRKKQISILVTLIALILVAMGATYAWFSLDRVSNTDRVSAKTNQDTVDLYVSSQGGTSFTNTYEADIKQVGNATKDELMPVSTDNLNQFVYAAISTSEKLQLAKDTKGQYYYHGRVYLKAKATGDHSGQKMTVYLDGSQEAGGDILSASDKKMINASRVGLTVGGKQAIIINFDNEKADKVVNCNGSTITYVKDPSNYVNDYLLKVVDGKATRPARALMTIELNKEYPVDIYYYMEGFDDDCTEAICEDDVKLHLAFFGVLE